MNEVQIEIGGVTCNFSNKEINSNNPKSKCCSPWSIKFWSCEKYTGDSVVWHKWLKDEKFKGMTFENELYGCKKKSCKRFYIFNSSIIALIAIALIWGIRYFLPSTLPPPKPQVSSQTYLFAHNKKCSVVELYSNDTWKEKNNTDICNCIWMQSNIDNFELNNTALIMIDSNISCIENDELSFQNHEVNYIDISDQYPNSWHTNQFYASVPIEDWKDAIYLTMDEGHKYIIGKDPKNSAKILIEPYKKHQTLPQEKIQQYAARPVYCDTAKSIFAEFNNTREVLYPAREAIGLGLAYIKKARL